MVASVRRRGWEECRLPETTVHTRKRGFCPKVGTRKAAEALKGACKSEGGEKTRGRARTRREDLVTGSARLSPGSNEPAARPDKDEEGGGGDAPDWDEEHTPEEIKSLYKTSGLN